MDGWSQIVDNFFLNHVEKNFLQEIGKTGMIPSIETMEPHQKTTTLEDNDLKRQKNTHVGTF